MTPDPPNIPCRHAEALGAQARLGLGDAWLRAVCRDSAAGLFGLGTAAFPPASSPDGG